MEHCGCNCLRSLTNGALRMELTEDSDKWRIVDGTV